MRKGKGNKDRPFIIPRCLKHELAAVIAENKEKGISFLFSGTKKSHLSIRSVQMILKKASKRAGIRKNIHPHTMRHSFATHVLEAGADVTLVQALLGHNEARTTIEYLHTIKPKLLSAKSPLDSIRLDNIQL